MAENEQDPQRAQLIAVVELLRREPARAADVEAFAKQVEVDTLTLDQLTRRHFHRSAADLLTRWRLGAACARLLEGADSFKSATSREALAADVGYANRPDFEHDFKRWLRLTPQLYRDLRGAQEFTIELPRWWRRAEVVRYWGRDPKSLQEHADATRIRWALSAPSGPLCLEVELGEDYARARLIGAIDDTSAVWAHGTLLRLLGLHLEPEAFEQHVLAGPHARLVHGRLGLTIPQTPSVFDGVVWVICGQQVSLPVAFSLRRRVAERFGRPVGGLLAPPVAADLAEVAPSELLNLSFSHRKAEYLCGIARLECEGKLVLEPLRHRPATEVEQRLLEVRGLGPWSVNYLMMRALGFADCVPVGDAGLARALVEFFELDRRPDPSRTQQLLQPFAPYRSLATFHFWASLKA